MTAPLDGVARIAAERAKQLAKWPAEHDDEHDFAEIAFHAGALALAVAEEDSIVPIDLIVDGDKLHPLQDGWGLVARHKDPIRRLEIAGALIAAEIDRRLREAAKDAGGAS